jgi:hypothetical protein
MQLAVADEISGDHHQVGVLGVGQRHRRPLHGVRRDPPDVHVGEVSHAQGRHLLHVRPGPGEAAELDTTTASSRSGQGRQWRNQHLANSLNDAATTV